VASVKLGQEASEAAAAAVLEARASGASEEEVKVRGHWLGSPWRKQEDLPVPVIGGDVCDVVTCAAALRLQGAACRDVPACCVQAAAAAAAAEAAAKSDLMSRSRHHVGDAQSRYYS
jgi:hypothetical protein